MLVTIESVEEMDDEHRWLGYKVVMSDPRKNVTCKISNDRLCCEQYGAHVDVPLVTFVGAQYLSVATEEHPTERAHGEDCGARFIVRIHTDRGTITMTLYNEHNGYYTHEFFIETEHGMNQKDL